MTQSPVREALGRAYRLTIYRVSLPGGGDLDLQVGRYCPALDGLLASVDCRHWAFVTAWNPASRSLPVWRNAWRSRRLARVLDSLGYRPLPGLGIPNEQGWRPEVSLLVLGMPAARALRIARQFGQNAIVAGRRGGPAELLWCHPREPAKVQAHRLSL